MSANNKTRWVVVDDDDPSFEFTGDWVVRRSDFEGYLAYGKTYRGSQHGTTTSGNLSFSFTGSELLLLGTSAVQDSEDGTRNPRWGCQVDGISIAAQRPYPGPANNYPLCKMDILSDVRWTGSHTLTVNATSGDGAIFWVDSIRYLPPGNATLDRPTVMIEHTDPSITYAIGNWQTITDTDRSDVILAMEPGATLGLSFTGSKITWVGWSPEGYPAGNSTATYSLDGGPPVAFNFSGPPSTFTLRYQTYFEIDSLSPEPHTLIVTHQGPSTPLTLDYFLVEDGDFLIPSNPLRVLPSSSTPSATPSRTAEPEASTSSDSPTGAIAGGVVGGVVIIVALGFIFFLLKRRDRRIELRANSATTYTQPIVYTPPPAATHFSHYPQISTSMNSGNVGNFTGSHPQWQEDPSPTLDPPHIIHPFDTSQILVANPPSSDSKGSDGRNQDNGSSQRLVPLRRGDMLGVPTSEARPNTAATVTSTTSASTFSTQDPSYSPQPVNHSNYANELYGGAVAGATFVRHQDSGIRLPPRVISLPPSYTRD
ncbi:hypothetical protein FA15DRAFT_620792 [Coprinopsis marcescibilis]|uniref:Transmembrane protein n=1 Tax=Coprinopsis marcescibilis TaxID=230819 RepID=A0A5C3KSB2_COPMA|nr:hypothetical protein FA15DRAFT_620792 [Coprinopsis marcescibilis]